MSTQAQIQTAVPPLIQGTENFLAISVGSVGLYQNTIDFCTKINILDLPTEPTDGTNKLYVDTYVNSKIVFPSEPFNSVQFNDDGFFGGSGDFTYDSGTQTLSIENANVNGTMIIYNPPIGPTDATNKQYVDSKIGSNPGFPLDSIQFNDGGIFGGSSDLTWDNNLGFLYVNGYITLPNLPINATDAVNKQYVDSQTGSTPGGADTDIQFNNSGTFGGSNNLTYNTGTNTISMVNGSVSGTLTLTNLPTNATDAANKQYVDSQSGSTPGGANTDIQFNSSGSFGGSNNLTYNTGTNTLSMINGSVSGAMTLTNLPTNATDAANKQYVDSQSTPPGGANTDIQFNSSGSFGGSSNLTYNTGTNTLSMINGSVSGAMTLTNLPTNATDAANKQYVDSQSTPPGGADTDIQFNSSGSFGGSSNLTYNTGTNTLSMINGSVSGTMTLTNLPTNTTDATNKQYVDGLFVPSAPDTSIQFNNSGSFDGSSNLTYNTGTNTLSMVNGSVSGAMTLTNLPTNATDAANKQYVDSQSTPPGGADTDIQFNSSGSFGGSSNLTYNTGTNTLSMINGSVSGAMTLTNLPTNATDAANKQYVDSQTGSTPGGADTDIQFNNSGAFGGSSNLTYNTGTNTLSMINGSVSGALTLTNLPTNATDAANKQYVDSQTGSTPGGVDTNVQFNSSGAFDGSSELTWNDTTKTLTVTGTVIVDALVTSSSSLLKKNIEKIDGCLDLLSRLDGYSYNLNNETKTTYGILAEEIEQLEEFKDLVLEHRGYKRVDYIQLIPFLIESIKELKEESNKIKNQLEKLIN